MKKFTPVRQFGLVALIAGLCLFACKKKKQHESHYAHVVKPTNNLPGYLNFPIPLSPDTPWDVDRKLQKKLTSEGKFVQTQRLFEILSWQWFISLNWPLDSSGSPQPKISDSGYPEWFEWKESYEVYKEDGSKPSPWGDFSFPPFFPNAKDATKDQKLLFRTNKFASLGDAHPDIDDEIDQAFTAPIWDQNGNIVRYEVRMNRVEFEYLLNNDLYNIQGQVKYSNTGPGADPKNGVYANVDFPKGNRKDAGAIEIKVAWKILEESDIKSRYFTTKGWVINEDQTSYSLKDVGMIGMHISSKTASSPQWIWTTFEHVDNMTVNELEVVDGKPLKASFFDPSCDTCPVNVFPDTTVAKPKTQIKRVAPITGATKSLNTQVQSLLKASGSKLQYYKQVGTQWPTVPSAKPYSPKMVVKGTDTTYVYKMPEAVTNKSGGMPTPTYLTNMIMETYFQGGTITGGNPDVPGNPPNDRVVQKFERRTKYGEPYVTKYTDTLAMYDTFIANEPAYMQIDNFPMGVDVKTTGQYIFGTESCIGCHYSGSIAKSIKMVDGVPTVIQGASASADFSWLLSQKAHFKK